MLIGSVRKAGDRVRITAQLVNAANDAQVWGERYDRDLNGIFALQDEISKAIAAALKLTLLPGEKAAIEQRATTNLEAYKLYLIGAAALADGQHRNSELCVRICTRVVELDPNYAQAWATLALAQWDVFHRGESTVSGEQAAATAVALDPFLADASAAVAESHRYGGRFAEGLDYCQKALRLDPASYMCNRVAGMCLMGLRRFNEAAGHFETAVAALESDFVAASFVVQCYEVNADTVRAREAARRALTRIEKVISVQPDHSRAIGFGVGLLATLGEKERATGMGAARAAARSAQRDHALQLFLRHGPAARPRNGVRTAARLHVAHGCGPHALARIRFGLRSDPRRPALRRDARGSKAAPGRRDLNRSPGQQSRISP